MVPVLSGATRVVASKSQVSATLSGEAVILGMDDAVYYGLDTVGTRFWALVQQPCSLDVAADQIESEFDVTRDRALADLIALATDLAARGLLEVLPVQPVS